MKPLRLSKKWILAAVGLLLAFFVLKIVLFLTAKPKITVDYVAEYNRLTRPANYDPNHNAAEDYQKAYDAFVNQPNELTLFYKDWPTDFNDADQVMLKEWLISNTQAFEYFREASNKPYYWLERHSREDNSMLSVTFPELSTLRQINEAIIWDAKLKAFQDQFQPAFENIISCYRAGNHKCHPSLFLTEQFYGLCTKKEAAKSALIVLSKLEIESKSLKFLQDALRAELTEDTYVPGIQAEKLALFDALQMTFIDNGRGTGRFAWRVGWYTYLCSELGKSDFWREYEDLKQRLYYCFIGPTRNQVAEQIEEVSDIYDQLKSQTPWQLKNQDVDYFEKIDKINNSYFLLSIIGIHPKRIFYSYHKTRAQTEALIAVLAVLRFKADTGQFPESLDKLVSAGYLQAVPDDPFSSGSLVYRLTEDNFTLYSVGKDFSDDGGTIKIKQASLPWLPGKNCPVVESYSDLVYWPVRRLKRAYFGY